MEDLRRPLVLSVDENRARLKEQRRRLAEADADFTGNRRQRRAAAKVARQVERIDRRLEKAGASG